MRCCSVISRRASLALEKVHKPLELLSLMGHLFRSGAQLFCRRGIALRHMIDLRHGAVHLRHALSLLS